MVGRVVGLGLGGVGGWGLGVGVGQVVRVNPPMAHRPPTPISILAGLRLRNTRIFMDLEHEDYPFQRGPNSNNNVTTQGLYRSTSSSGLGAGSEAELV